MKSFADRLREDRRLVTLRLLLETRGYSLNSSNLHAGLDYLSIKCTRAEVLADLRFLSDNGLVKLEPLADIEGLYGCTLTRAGREVAQGVQEVAGVSTPGPR
jgi:hypothetical protein